MPKKIRRKCTKGNMNKKKMLVEIWSANYCFFFHKGFFTQFAL